MLSTIMNLLRRKNLEKKKKLSQLNSCSSRESQLFGKRIWKKKKKKKQRRRGLEELKGQVYLREIRLEEEMFKKENWKVNTVKVY
jgi:hypothetical protein